ncbi:UMP kinase [bacterium]|nr:UMP kinase [bacterium]
MAADKSGPAARTVLLKLSGEALGGPDGAGIHVSAIQSIAAQVAEVNRSGVRVAVVLGGGNLWRGAEKELDGFDRTTADYMGMLATVMNAIAFQTVLERMGVESRVMSAIELHQLCERYIRRRALRHLDKGRVVIFAGGTGNPYFTTDSAAALRALEISADALYKATKVRGVYSADPVKVPDAQFFPRLTYKEVLERGLRVMDSTAISMCMDHDLPVIVFDMNEPGNIRRALLGEDVGTSVGT